jgi:hypothetical protein
MISLERGPAASTWVWGAPWQVWACRVSQLMGLGAVLGLLWLVGLGQ